MIAIFLLIVIVSLFIAIGLACAVRIALPRKPASDPFSIPFGEMPGFSEAQLRAIARRSEARSRRDPLRRSFATRALPATGDDENRFSEFRRACHPHRDDAGGGFPFILSGLAAVRDFLGDLVHRCRRGFRHA